MHWFMHVVVELSCARVRYKIEDSTRSFRIILTNCEDVLFLVSIFKLK